MAIVARLLLYIGALAAIGNVGVSWTRGAPWSSRLEATSRTQLLAAWCAVLTACVLLFLAQFAALELSPTTDDVAMLVRQTAWGRGWMLLVLCGVLGVIVSAFRGSRTLRTLVVCAFAVAMGGLGHAAADDVAPWFSRAIDAAHVLGVGAWLGTLMWMQSASNAVDGASWQRFSVAANVAAPLALLSGAGASVRRLYGNSLADIVHSAYGQSLIWKLVFVTVIVVLGAVHRRQVLQTKRPGAGTVRIELLLSVLVLCITAVLTGQAPPGD